MINSGVNMKNDGQTRLFHRKKRPDLRDITIDPVITEHFLIKELRMWTNYVDILKKNVV